MKLVVKFVIFTLSQLVLVC